MNLDRRYWAAFAAILVIGIAFYARGVLGDREAELAGSAIEREEDPAAGPNVVAVREQAREAVDSQQVSGPSVARTDLRLLVVEASTGDPLIAIVDARVRRGGRVVASSRVTGGSGEFVLGEGLDFLEHIHVHARGYLPADLTPADWRAPSDGPLVVELEARGVCRVRVVDSAGNTAGDVPLEWSRASSGSAASWRAEEFVVGPTTRTDRDGQSTLASSRPQWVRIAAEGAAVLGERVLVRPDTEEAILHLPAHSSRLVFVDADTGEPMPGLQLAVYSSQLGGVSARNVRTDDDGVVVLSGLVAPYVLTLDRLDGARFDSFQEGDSIEVLRGNLEIDLDGPGLAADRDIRVRVEDCGFSLLCVAAADDQAIEAPVSLKLDFERAGLGWWGGHWYGVPSRSGLVRIQCLPALGDDWSDIRVSIQPVGFEPRVLDIAELRLLDKASGGPVRLVFEPQMAHTLVFQSNSGAPYPVGDYRLSEVEGDLQLASGSSSLSGETQPFSWHAGDLRIMLRSRLGGGFGAVGGKATAALELTVRADQLEASDTVIVSVPRELGRIEIVACDLPLESMLAKHESGLELQPTGLRDGVIDFGAVPAGDWAVGPRPWVRSIWDRKFARLAGDFVHVSPGRTLRLDCDADWAMQTPLSGRVQVSGSGDEPLYLLPFYGQCGRLSALSVARLGIPLDADGRYTLPAGDPRPAGLVVCSLEPVSGIRRKGGNGVRPLAVISPGSDAEIALTRLTLHWPRELAWPGRVRVSFTLSEEQLEGACGKAVAGGGPYAVFVDWPSVDPLVIESIPGRSVDVSIEGPNGELRLNERIQFGQDFSVDHEVSPPGH